MEAKNQVILLLKEQSKREQERADREQERDDREQNRGRERTELLLQLKAANYKLQEARGDLLKIKSRFSMRGVLGGLAVLVTK